MSVLYFCIGFIICTISFCGGFVFCLRAWHLHKNEHTDPIYTFKPRKTIDAAQRIKKDETISMIMGKG